MIAVSAYTEQNDRFSRMRATLELGMKERGPISKKAGEYFANMFSPFGSTHIAHTDSPSASPRFSVQDVSKLCTYVVSEKHETIRRIVNTYLEVAELTVENTLTLKEKMSRIATYLGALILVLNSKVCHGDQKPENILWDDDRFVLSDFNGSILLDDVCSLMNKDFVLEGEDYKNKLSAVVSALCKNSPQLQAVCKSNPTQVKKLIKWGIVNSELQVLDADRLKLLSSYLRTKYFPDHSKGYASEQYLKKMGDYFWQCDPVNYVRAAQAFDIRAAGLTIAIILTQVRSPLKEDDVVYYDRLEVLLRNLAIPERAISIIRRMAEPSVRKFGRQFSMPVEIEELKELEQIFGNKETVVPEDVTFIYRQSSSFKSPGHLKETLDSVQDAIERLSLIEGDEEDSVRLKVMENLIFALSQDDISTLVNKLPPQDKIDCHTRKELIERCFDAYPVSCETRIGAHTALLLLDTNNQHRCDVLLKKEMVGDGASAVAFKALSLRSLSYVVVKYFQELADPNEAERAQMVLSQIGKHEGVQNVSQTFIVQTAEGDKKVVVDSFYKKRDYGAAVHGEILCSRLKMPREYWGDSNKVKTALTELNRELLQFLLSNKPANEKHLKLKDFFNDCGGSLIAILGMHKGKQLLEDYNSLITELPQESIKQEPAKEEEEKKSPRKFTVKDLLPFPLPATKSPRSSPREPSSRRNSIDLRTESFSWIELDLDAPCKPPEIDATIEVINVKALELLLQGPNVSRDQSIEIITNAKEITLKAIRTCQRLILFDYLKVHADPRSDVNPAMVSKTWQKQADKMGETHLDIKGLNHISKLLGVEVVVQPSDESVRQKTLRKLLDTKAQVWQLAPFF